MGCGGSPPPEEVPCWGLRASGRADVSPSGSVPATFRVSFTQAWSFRVLKVALTGNIASGKSSVARVWRELGAHVIEADGLARRAVAPGTEALERIVDRWGPGVLLPDGELDRAALRDVVFRDDAERAALEAIVHPEVRKLREREVDQLAEAGVDVVVSDIPLLFEAGMEQEFDVVVLVDSPEEVRLDRLVRDRGLRAAEAARMIAAQWPVDAKRKGADIVIENSGSLKELEARARRVWADVRTRAKWGGSDP
jgi:dephospho-CoA kinase